jgi:transglutaminase-like putative cysteine protease
VRLRIVHETTYRYGTPAASVTQVLRLTPRSHDGQFVHDWRIELDQDGHLRQSADAFGNVVHSLTLSGPLEALTITATGDVETENTNGVIRGQIERFPAPIFLRDTPLTEPDAEIRAFAGDIAGLAGRDRLTLLHDLTTALNRHMEFDTRPTDATTPAAEAFAHGHGVCQDFAHIFIAAARHIGIPARYVSGHLFQKKAGELVAGHGWAEAMVEGLGWVAFDPANGISATDAYLRVAVGLDYLGAAPVRGSRHGGAEEKLGVKVRVTDVRPRR